MLRYLLDTNICIFIINRRPESVRQHLERMSIGDVGVSTITVSELEYGIAKSGQVERNRAALEKFLLPLEVLDFTREAASHYGGLRQHLEARGTPIGAMDLMIAAQCLAAGLTLVTNNTREFERVPSLNLDDWTKAAGEV